MSTIDVWLLAVPQGGADDPTLKNLLSPVERRRIADFGMPADRDRAVTARAAARLELGRRLGVAPSKVGLRSIGAPEVAGTNLSVSWSHSGAWVALAIAGDRTVGIDIEQIPHRPVLPALDFLGIATLEDFVGLEAASKATGCTHGGAWPPEIRVRRLAAPAGYTAAVAAPGTDWAPEVHMRSPLDDLLNPCKSRGSETLRPLEALCYARLRPHPSWEG